MEWGTLILEVIAKTDASSRTGYEMQAITITSSLLAVVKRGCKL